MSSVIEAKTFNSQASTLSLNKESCSGQLQGRAYTRKILEPGLPGGSGGETRVHFLALAIIFFVLAIVSSLFFGGVFGPQFVLASQICGTVFVGLTLLVAAAYLFRLGTK